MENKLSATAIVAGIPITEFDQIAISPTGHAVWHGDGQNDTDVARPRTTRSTQTGPQRPNPLHHLPLGAPRSNAKPDQHSRQGGGAGEAYEVEHDRLNSARGARTEGLHEILIRWSAEELG